MSYSALRNLQNSTKESKQVEKLSQLWQEGPPVLVMSKKIFYAVAGREAFIIINHENIKGLLGPSGIRCL
jgi:hypothetical protein